MTDLGTRTTASATPVSAYSLVVTDAVGKALRRDLDRLLHVLGEPVTSVRRDALAGHICYLLDQVDAHQWLLDAVIWPAAVAVEPDLRDLGEQVRCAHDELGASLARLRTAAVEWRGAGGQRLAVRSAVQALALLLPAVLDQDAELLPLACADAGDPITGSSSTAAPWVAGQGAPGRRVGPGPDVRRSEAGPAVATGPRTGRSFVAPTTLARRLFWLLDDLDAATTTALLDRVSRTTMWILRNGFSGAYNRQSYLMWVGGGSGPAV